MRPEVIAIKLPGGLDGLDGVDATSVSGCGKGFRSGLGRSSLRSGGGLIGERELIRPESRGR